jgi:hypothetical protein
LGAGVTFKLLSGMSLAGVFGAADDSTLRQPNLLSIIWRVILPDKNFL